MLIIDSPVNEFSTAAAIQAWLVELGEMLKTVKKADRKQVQREVVRAKEQLAGSTPPGESAPLGKVLFTR